ncbi:MAG: alpha/beta hydrolase [Curvibacter sp.]|nr:MAG: alpha/beta hydrolase [Curvibacter sp.]
MSLIIFSHANSFPAGTYQVLFKQLRQRGFKVKALEQFGHDERYPVTSNWPHLVQQLADFAEREIVKAGEPAFLVGHSLGGFLSVMAAARHPKLGGHGVKGVVLIDSPLLGGWRANALGVIKQTQLVGSVSPGKISRRRRNAWANADEALAHFQHKKAFARWDPQVLQDYISHGTRDEDGPQGPRRVLCFDRDVETAIYNTLPHNLDSLLARHPLRCPAAFIGGLASQEMQQVGMAMTEKVVKGRIMMLDGSHLFPMEKPLATAAALEASLRNLETVKA